MKSLINSDFVSIIMLTYTGLDKTYYSNFPQGFLMKSLINSDFVSIIMLTYTGLDKTYDLAHYTKRAPAFGIIRSTKIHSYTERSARSYDNPKCKK